MAVELFQIPLSGMPQRFLIQLGDVNYYLTFEFRWAANAGWTLDIADVDSNPLICGIPLVTGANLLAQYEYLGFSRDVALAVRSDGDPEAVPTFNNLGLYSHVYWVTGLLSEAA